ncbi:MAG: hypothetical protein J3Q66DRAFT_343708 [Benniella sp.]|nr:MAG: hypothetical protein J3Q66DRAFT_343708 [Benniella sp.]
MNPSSALHTLVPNPLTQTMFQKHYMQQQRQRQQPQLSTFNPIRLSHPNTTTSSLQSLQQQHQDPSQVQPQPLSLSPSPPQQVPPQQVPPQQVPPQEQGQFNEKPTSGPGRLGGPPLSLDTSNERLQNIKVIELGNKRYLKLFSPSLVESPVSFLNHKQQIADQELWKNGPNEAFQKQLDMEKREAFRARSKQLLHGFLMGLWLGCLMVLLILQQTSARVHLLRHDLTSSSSPLVILLIIVSCVAIARSGTQFIVAAVGTCITVLTCFATLTANQYRYPADIRLYKRMPPMYSTN